MFYLRYTCSQIPIKLHLVFWRVTQSRLVDTNWALPDIFYIFLLYESFKKMRLCCLYMRHFIDEIWYIAFSGIFRLRWNSWSSHDKGPERLFEGQYMLPHAHYCRKIKFFVLFFIFTVVNIWKRRYNDAIQSHFHCSYFLFTGILLCEILDERIRRKSCEGKNWNFGEN